MDSKIIKKIKERDKVGLNLLINNYSKNIYYIVDTLIDDNENKEKINEYVSDILLNIWNDIYEIDRDKNSFKSFILKKSKETIFENEVKTEDTDREFKHRIEEKNSENSKEMLSIIKSFKNPDKTYFYLNYVMDYDIEIIANKYGEHISTVQNTLCRCGLKLKNIIEKEVIINGK